MIAGSLEIQMLANMAELKKQMDQGVGIVKGASDQMIKAADMAGKALGLLGVTLTIGAFTGFIKNAIDAADALDEMSGRVGVSAKELSQLQLAYRQAGLGNDAMASSLNKLSKEMADGNVGLRALNINARNADGTLKSTTAVLFEVADKFKGLEDGAGKTALAMEIFGKSGAEMVPMLNSGSDGIRELTELSEKLGIVIEDDTAAKAGQFNDTLELLQLGMQGIGTRVGAQLLPTLNNLTGSFLQSMTEGDRLSRVADILSTSMKGLYSAGVGVVEVFNTVGKSLGGGVAALMAVMKGDLSGAKRILDEAKTDIMNGWASSARAISAAWSDEANAGVEATARMVRTNNDLLAAQKAREESAKKAAAAAEKAAAEQAKLAADGAKLIDGLIAQDGGLSNDFHEKWEKMNAARRDGKRSVEDLIKAQAELLAQQPFMKKGIEEEAAAWKAWRDERKQALDAVISAAQSMEVSNKQLRDEIQLIGKTKAEQATILRLRREQEIATKELALANLQAKNSFDALDQAMIEGLQEQIKQLKERNELMGAKDTADKAAEETEKVKEKFTDTVKQVEDVFVRGFADMMNNGKSGWDSFCQSLKTSFFTLVAQQIYAAMAKPFVVQLVGSFLGIAGSGAGSAAMQVASGGSNLGGLGGLIPGGGTGGLFGNFNAGMAGGWTGFEGGISMMQNGEYLAGGMQALGAAAPYIGALIQLGKGNIAGGLGTAAGAYIGSLFPVIGTALGAVLGSLFGNVLSGLFGRKLKDSGIEGKYSDKDGFSGNTFEFYKGGLFRSNKTVRKPLDDETAKVFADQFNALDTAVRGMAESVGLSADVLDNFSYEFKLSLKGLSEADAQKKIQEMFLDVGDKMAASVLATDKYTQAGETSLQTLTRLSSSLLAANVVLEQTGGKMFEVSLAGADMASDLMDAFGGVDNFKSLTSNYYDKYFTDAEKLANVNKQVGKAFEALGYNSVPATRDALKEMINAQDLTTEEGRKAYASLLALAGVLDVVYSASEQIKQLNQSMDIELLRLEGREEEAIHLERMQRLEELKGMGDEVIAKQQEIWKLEDEAKQRELVLAMTGLSVDSLVDGFIQEINEGRGAQAGTWLADQIAVGFEQAIYGQAVTIIMSAILDGVITPVVTAAMTGSSVSAAVSGAAIENMVANAKAAAAALGILLSDPAFKEALAEVKKTITTLGNDIGRTIPPMSTYRRETVNVGNSYKDTTNAADEAAKAAKRLADSMKSLGDSIVKEVQRIRGLIVGDGAAGFAEMQARFAIATAQARAGDEEAAKSLPGLSRDLLELAKTNARTSADLKFFQAQTAASLQATVEAMAAKFGFQIPAFADGGYHSGGWALVGERGPELAYMPPSYVYTAPQTRDLMGGSGGSDAGWQYLAAELSTTNERLRNVERHTRKTAETLEGWDRNGQPEEREVTA